MTLRWMNNDYIFTFGWSMLLNSNRAGITSASQWHRCFIQLQYLKVNVSSNLIIQVICFCITKQFRRQRIICQDNENMTSLRRIHAHLPFICTRHLSVNPLSDKNDKHTRQTWNDLTVCESHSFISVCTGAPSALMPTAVASWTLAPDSRLFHQ